MYVLYTNLDELPNWIYWNNDETYRLYNSRLAIPSRIVTRKSKEGEKAYSWNQSKISNI